MKCWQEKPNMLSFLKALVSYFFGERTYVYAYKRHEYGPEYNFTVKAKSQNEADRAARNILDNMAQKNDRFIGRVPECRRVLKILEFMGQNGIDKESTETIMKELN